MMGEIMQFPETVEEFFNILTLMYRRKRKCKLNHQKYGF